MQKKPFKANLCIIRTTTIITTKTAMTMLIIALGAFTI